MRSLVSFALLAVALAAGAAAAHPRALRCCVTLDTPTAPPGPVCVQLHSRRPRLACRLIGGRPAGHGDCTLALCLGR